MCVLLWILISLHVYYTSCVVCWPHYMWFTHHVWCVDLITCSQHVWCVDLITYVQHVCFCWICRFSNKWRFLISYCLQLNVLCGAVQPSLKAVSNLVVSNTDNSWDCWAHCVQLSSWCNRIMMQNDVTWCSTGECFTLCWNFRFKKSWEPCKVERDLGSAWVCNQQKEQRL